MIEEFDREVPRIRALKPDVVLVTGDHSTPGPMKGHSWHSVPFLLHGRWVEPQETAALLEPYGEWAALASVYLISGYARGLVPLPGPSWAKRPPAFFRTAPATA